MILLNSTKLGKKQYTIQDSRGFVPLEKLDLLTGFYGGRVRQLARTEQKGLYLCLDYNNNVIDIYIDEKELESFTNKELEDILSTKKEKFPNKATKEELIKLIQLKLRW